MEQYCPCVKDHVPNPKVLHRHHIIPKAWGGSDVSPQVYRQPDGTIGNLVRLCPTAHENVHKLLNQYIHEEGKPEWDFREHFTHLESLLAEIAWGWWMEQNEGIYVKPPWTMSSTAERTDLV